MASLSTPTLTLGATTGNKRDVTVSGTMSFGAGDVGKTYRLEIKLYGEDKAGDALPTTDAVGDDVINTFRWSTGLIFLPFKTLTVAAAGTVSYSEKRAIDVEALDEDPGKHLVGMADINTPVFVPHKDEVYARTTLSGAPVTARSATVVSGVGV